MIQHNAVAIERLSLYSFMRGFARIVPVKKKVEWLLLITCHVYPHAMSLTMLVKKKKERLKCLFTNQMTLITTCFKTSKSGLHLFMPTYCGNMSVNIVLNEFVFFNPL